MGIEKGKEERQTLVIEWINVVEKGLESFFLQLVLQSTWCWLFYDSEESLFDKKGQKRSEKNSEWASSFRKAQLPSNLRERLTFRSTQMESSRCIILVLGLLVLEPETPSE